MAEELKACPCPFCGDTPGEDAHTLTDGGFKYGAIQCSCGAIGPDVRTEYKDWPHWKDAAIREWNTRAQLPSQGGEAVEVVGYACPQQLKAMQRDTSASCAIWNSPGRPHPSMAERAPLMTVAQHQRILAAATHPADQVADGVAVSRELRSVLAMILNALDRDAAEGKQARGEMAQELRALMEVKP